MADEAPQPPLPVKYRMQDLTPVDYPWSTDKAFKTPAKNYFRVQVRRSNAAHSNMGDAAGVAAPTAITLTVQISLVDKKLWTQSVNGDGPGGLVIFDIHEILIKPEQMAMPDWNTAAVLEAVIAERIWDHEQTLGKQIDHAAYLANEWGITDMPFVPTAAQAPVKVTDELPPIVEGAEASVAHVVEQLPVAKE